MKHVITQTRATLHQWFEQPLRAAFLLAVAGLLMMSGPWACLAHCAALEAMYAAHPAMRHVHGFDTAHGSLECPSELQAPDHALDVPPSAITQGIVLPIEMLVISIGIAVLALAPAIHVRPVFLPPPSEPPRLRLRFAA